MTIIRPERPRIHVVPLTIAEANELVSRWHRHHEAAIGHRFSIGVVDGDGVPHGAAIVGHAVARLAGTPRAVAEVTRLVTDGTYNACSMLYAASARAAQALGYERIQTYILDSEQGTSLKASGWTDEGPAGGGDWSDDGRHRKRARSFPKTMKRRWAKTLNPSRPEMQLTIADKAGTASLWDTVQGG